jgi:hypothetical protein
MKKSCFVAMLGIGALLLMPSPSPASIGCNFELVITNITDSNIRIDEVHYKLHDSSWEEVQIKGSNEILGGSNHNSGNRIVVANMVASCDSYVKWSFKYHCHDRSKHHSESPLLQCQDIDEVNDYSTISAQVNDCEGSVDWSPY